MKNLFLILVLTVSSLGTAQTKRFSLQLKTNDKVSLHGVSFWTEAEIKSKDTSFVYALHSLREDKIPNLKTGDYTIVIHSMFGQKVSKKISLKKNSAVKFKLEKLNKKSSARVFSSTMNDGDTLFMLHNASGMPLAKIGVTLQKNQYWSLAYYKAKGNSVLDKKKVSESALEFLKKTETEAPSYNKSSGCSVIETYTFQLNGKYYSINDGTCKWGRFHKLAGALFPVSED